MRIRLFLVFGIAALLATPLLAQPASCGRIGVRAGAGTKPYDPARDRNSAKFISWDDFRKLKYPHAANSINDFPRFISPTRRFGAFEQTLFAMEGIISCPSFSNGFRSEEFRATVFDPDSRSTLQIENPAMDTCLYGSPNFDRIKDFSRTIDAWSKGCAIENRRVRVIGYGFWDEIISANSSVFPSMSPVLDIIVLDKDGNEVPSPTAPDPDEDIEDETPVLRANIRVATKRLGQIQVDLTGS